ncbi:hypothetical protein EDD86DRAFT_246145 [Gorgonomyces haynaldii]|nr:hypothetical protein EDD86DRAFT_246145 [Gorgonomyces haynaldii]
MILPLIASAAARTLDITLTADNSWEMFISSKTATESIVGPKDGDNGIQYGWNNTKKISRTIGDGPVVIGIKATDYGVVAGLFAHVKVDGQYFTHTGPANSKVYVSTAAVASDWYKLPYEPSKWQIASSTPACLNGEASWGQQFMKQLITLSGDNKEIKAVWGGPNSCNTLNSVQYFRILIPASAKCPKY